MRGEGGEGVDEEGDCCTAGWLPRGSGLTVAAPHPPLPPAHPHLASTSAGGVFLGSRIGRRGVEGGHHHCLSGLGPPGQTAPLIPFP